MRKTFLLLILNFLVLSVKTYSQHYVTNEYRHYFQGNQISEIKICNHYLFKINQQGKIFEIQDSIVNGNICIYKFDSLGRINSYFELVFLGYSYNWDTICSVTVIRHGSHNRLAAFHLRRFRSTWNGLEKIEELIFQNDSLFEYGYNVMGKMDLLSITVLRFDSCKSGFTERDFCYLKTRNKYLLDRIEISHYNRKFEIENSYAIYPSDYIYLGDSIPGNEPELYFRIDNKSDHKEYKRVKRRKWGYDGFRIFIPQNYIHGKHKPDPFYQCDWDLRFIIRKNAQTVIIKKHNSHVN